MKLEVRCCCQPQKLLGWFEFSWSGDTPPWTLRFPKRAPTGSLYGRFLTVELPVARINVDGRSYFAVKAEGMTVAELQQLGGFVAA